MARTGIAFLAVVLVAAAAPAPAAARDTAAPSIVGSGPLWERAEGVVGGGDGLIVRARAVDGHASRPESGVARVEVRLDGRLVAARRADGRCRRGPCALRVRWRLDADRHRPGDHLLALVARDRAGNRHAERVAFTLAPPRARAAARAPKPEILCPDWADPDRPAFFDRAEVLCGARAWGGEAPGERDDRRVVTEPRPGVIVQDPHARLSLVTVRRGWHRLVDSFGTPVARLRQVDRDTHVVRTAAGRPVDRFHTPAGVVVQGRGCMASETLERTHAMVVVNAGGELRGFLPRRALRRVPAQLLDDNAAPCGRDRASGPGVPRALVRQAFRPGTERSQGRGSFARCFAARPRYPLTSQTADPDCGGSYRNYASPPYARYAVLAYNTTGVAFGGIASAIVSVPRTVAEIGAFRYVDENVPCTRPYVARWVRVDANPGGLPVVGWTPLREPSGRARTPEQGHPECVPPPPPPPPPAPAEPPPAEGGGAAAP